MVFECKGDKISRSLYGPVRRSCTYCAAFLRGAMRGLTARLNCATVWRDGRRVQQPNPPPPGLREKRVGCHNLTVHSSLILPTNVVEICELLFLDWPIIGQSMFNCCRQALVKKNRQLYL